MPLPGLFCLHIAWSRLRFGSMSLLCCAPVLTRSKLWHIEQQYVIGALSHMHEEAGSPRTAAASRAGKLTDPTSVPVAA